MKCSVEIQGSTSGEFGQPALERMQYIAVLNPTYSLQIEFNVVEDGKKKLPTLDKATIIGCIVKHLQTSTVRKIAQPRKMDHLIRGIA